MCISLLGLLDKKKSRRNLPFAFAVNLVKNLVHFFHAPSVSYSVGRAFQNKILWFFFLSKWSKFIYWRFSFFSFVNFDRDLARAYGNVRESTTCKTCLTRTSFKSLSVELAKCPFLFYENQNWKRLAHKTWMHKMSAVILWNSCFTRGGERWLCILYNYNNKK